MQQRTGTGVIRPFVRLDNASQPIEKGFNTDFRPIDANNDAKQDAQYTHSFKVADLENVGGYYLFLLDANQTGGAPLLDLNDLKIYVSNDASLHGYTGSGFTSGLSTLVYNMDGAGDSGVTLNVQ